MYLKLFSLNSLEIYKKLSITKSDQSNVAVATLLKTLSLMDTFLRINKEFRNNFFKEHIQQATFTAFQQMEIEGFDLKLLF